MIDSSYKFLSNVPIGQDLFEGKSQEKIANLLSEVLQKDDFQIIGIDGGWGTGKSNLVKIVETKLQKECNFFIYDVWGHQEDDQRKAILVELTEYIADQNSGLSVQHKKWADKLDRLLSKEKRVTTITIPFLSIGFILSLFLIIYVPSVTVFVKDLEKDKFYTKLVLVMLPIIIWFGIYICKLIGNFKKAKTRWTRNNVKSSLKLTLQQMMQVYGSKQTDETKVETISEKEPTVRDFRDWMKEIDFDLGTNRKKMVIVLDNFDRLSKKHIQSIWSSIHIFFHEEKYKNIKVIIPFDRAHIRTAFSELNGSEKEKIGPNFANDYINKTFDLVYRISPPIMSNWKSFFAKCWMDAVQSHYEEAEYIKIEQIFETYAQTVTPREIIAFINEVVSVIQLYNKIPARYIGIFVLNKDTILVDPLKAITEADFLRGLGYLYKEDDNFQKYITSLSYQIDPDNALEVVYTKRLKESLVNREINNLNEIAKTEIFSKIIFSVLNDLDDYEMPVMALDKLSSEANISKTKLEYAWSIVYIKEKKKPFTGFILKAHQKTIFKRIDINEKIEWVLTHLNALQAASEFQVVEYAKVVDEYDTIDRENSFNIDIFKLLKPKKIDPEALLSLVDTYQKSYSLFKITTGEKELNDILIDQINDNPYALVAIEYLVPYYNFDRVKDKIIARISKVKSDYEQLRQLFPPLKHIMKSKGLIGTLLTDSEINNYYGDSDEDDDLGYDMVAMFLARGNNYQVSTDEYLQPELDQDPLPEFVKKVSERIQYYINYEALLKLSTSFNSSLMKAVIQDVVQNNYQMQSVDVRELIEIFDKVCEANELDPFLFMNGLNSWNTPEFDSTLFESTPPLFCQTAVSSDTNLGKEFITSLNNYFDTLTTNSWVDIFKNTENNIFCALKIINYSNWKSFAITAFEKVLLEMISISLIKNPTDHLYIIQSFKDSGKNLTNLFKNIRDEFTSGRTKMIPLLFEFIGDAILETGEIQEKSVDVFRTILIPSLLTSEPCLNILKKHNTIIKKLLKNAPKTDSASLVDTIIDLNDNQSVKEFGDLIGLKKHSKEKNEGNNKKSGT
ncbi:P-loop NTPase fold protein [Chitinophaga sp. 22536]|uniref:P-loop NTPase fold protein n=1 Tax=unclassified Chitinophaga TaxID=2619133 RepID=UPI003F87F012